MFLSPKAHKENIYTSGVVCGNRSEFLRKVKLLEEVTCNSCINIGKQQALIRQLTDMQKFSFRGVIRENSQTKI